MGIINSLRLSLMMINLKRIVFFIDFSFDASEIRKDFNYPEIYIDDLEFECNSNSLKKEEVLNTIYIDEFGILKFQDSSLREGLSYAIFNLEGKLVRSGVVTESLKFTRTDDFQFIKVYNTTFQKTFKLPPY